MKSKAQSKSQINAFKADPMNQFAKDKPVLFYFIIASVFYAVIFISWDIFFIASDCGPLPTKPRLVFTCYILLMSFSTTWGIKKRWKRIEKQANQSIEAIVTTPVD